MFKCDICEGEFADLYAFEGHQGHCPADMTIPEPEREEILSIGGISVGHYYARRNKVRQVLRIYYAFSSAYGKPAEHVAWRWASGRWKDKHGVSLLNQFEAWSEGETLADYVEDTGTSLGG